MKYSLINKKPWVVALTAITGLSAMSANANVYTYSDTVNVTEGSSLTGVNNLVVPRYFGDAADLISVEVRITLSVPSFTLQVDNDATEAATGDVSFGTLGGVLFSSTSSTLDGSFTTLSGSNFAVATQTDNFSVAANDIDATTGFDFDAGADNHEFDTTSVTVGQTTYRFINSSVFSQWASGGNVTFDLAADFVTDLNVDTGGGGGVVRFQGAIPTAVYTVDVIYTDSIPEPSSALLGGLGLLFLLRRKR